MPRILAALEELGRDRFGYEDQRWITQCIADAIARLTVTDVHYTQSSISALLKKWEWSWQQPKRWDSRRNEAKIEHWRKVHWPALKKGAEARGETLIFVDGSSFHLSSHHQKTFAPVDKTPVVKGKRGQSPRHMVTGAVSPRRARLFQLVDGNREGHHDRPIPEDAVAVLSRQAACYLEQFTGDKRCVIC